MRNVSAEEKRPDRRFLKITLAQAVAGAAILAAVLLAMKFDRPLFEQLQSRFSALMAQDFDPESITFFPFPAGDPAEKPTLAAGTQPETETAQTEAAGTQAASADAPAEAASAPGTEPAAAAGGEDLCDADVEKMVSFELYETGERAVLPVSGGRVTSGFGARVHPIYGTAGFHSGKDIAVPEGSPIYAALDGEVIGAGWGESAGNYVKLRHDNGVETLYCHCSALNVETGVKVRKGDVIAFVGQTGLATGPHVHFEVHIDGVKCDPDHLLENACSVS